MKTLSIMGKATFNAMQTICRIDNELEKSGVVILNSVGANLQPSKKRKCKKLNETEEKLDETVENLDKTVELIKELATYLRVTPLQTALFCAFLSKSNFSFCNSVDLEHIHYYFDFSYLNMLCLSQDIQKLVDKCLIDKIFECGGIRYRVNREVRMSIIRNTKITTAKPKELSAYDFVKDVSHVIEFRSNDNISSNELFSTVEDIENRNSGLSFVKDVKKLVADIENRTLFYKICDDYINTKERETGVNDTLSDMYEFWNDQRKVTYEILSECHVLQKLELIQLVPAIMASGANVELTEKGKRLFLGEDIQLFDGKLKNRELIYPDKINAKTLFYEKSLQSQITNLERNLKNEQFVKLQARLSEKALPQGIAAIFYGAPGTGKTETALQLAKSTGRAIMQVDISATKSCWFGESEKIIKKIFSSYKELCKSETLKPILLFNEADAVFSKRKDIDSSSVDKTENAIQNIILEEMEKLDGILIATTNLMNNLDDAFERRFLFKIRFSNPTLEAKQAIWKDKLSWLTDDECMKLSASYNFSGGEIDNVVRKALMEEVFTGCQPSFSFIEQMCSNEKLLGNQHRAIGFR